MIIPNKTHYFNENTKLFNCVPDPSTFGMESSKRLGYFQRLYFEFEYTKSVGGKVFFYTLTYNNSAINTFHVDYRDNEGVLVHEDIPCFNYADIRLVTNGLISKRLLREYGSKLRYFCACEHGDGKGKRGLGNNPHLHFIFFVQPANDDYKPISAIEFRDLIREVWHGTTKNIRWKNCRFGHAQEGYSLGVVDCSDALSYCGKYVIKDTIEKNHEFKVKRHFEYKLESLLYSYHSLYMYYQYLKNTNPYFTKNQFSNLLGLDNFFYIRRSFCYVSKPVYDLFGNIISYESKRVLNPLMPLEKFVSGPIDNLIRHNWLAYKDWFFTLYKDSYVSSSLNEFRCLYGSKPRLSKSLGIYGLNFIEDKMQNPRIKLVVGDKYKVCYPCLYYLRKMFYNVERCPFSGNVVYVLNDDGRKLKLNQFESRINQMIYNTKKYISMFYMNHLNFDYKNRSFYLVSDFSKISHHIIVNDSDSVKHFMDSLFYRSDFERILYRYAVYSLVYKYRCYSQSFSTLIHDPISLNDVKEDYDLFLRHNFYVLDYDSSVVSDASYKWKDSLSFASHPLFRDYVKYFDFLDALSDFVSGYVSDVKKISYEETSQHLKRLKAFKFNNQISL